LKDPRTGLYNFDPYLRKIVQPQDFNFDMLPAYRRPSQDSRLIELARVHRKRFIGASSSLVGMLSQLYLLISNMKPINTATLSHTYVKQLRTFTRLSRGPFSVMILPKDNGSMYIVDPDHRDDPRLDDQDERILMDLGKSMEVMLTLPEQKFLKMLKSVSEESNLSNDGQSMIPDDVFHYSTIEDFFVRSQLDCHHPSLPNKTFDLKTRATLAIRYDITRYRERLHYSLDRRFGLWQSFERELYDMIRAAMLKYNFQVRLGHMDGIFVTYHNTAEIFGFEYVPREDMDLLLFGGVNYGNEAYRLCFKLLSHLFNRIVDHFPNDPIRLLVRVDENRPGRMELFVEKLQWDPSNPDSLLPSNRQNLNVVKYELNVFSSLDGFRIDGFEVPSDEANRWEIHFRIDRDTHHPPAHTLLEYGQVLSKIQDLRKSHPKYVDQIMQQLSINPTASSSPSSSSFPSFSSSSSTQKPVSPSTTSQDGSPMERTSTNGGWSMIHGQSPISPSNASAQSPHTPSDKKIVQTHQIPTTSRLFAIPDELASLSTEQLKTLAASLGMTQQLLNDNPILLLQVHLKILEMAKKSAAASSS
jgi:hypothetical protein